MMSEASRQFSFARYKLESSMLQDYTAYVHWAYAHLYALKRAGFSLQEIAKMTDQERRELGAIALSDERRR